MQTPLDRISYNLVATVGLIPAVVTELIWALGHDPVNPMVPNQIVLISTAKGQAIWEETLDDSGEWDRLFNEVLGIEPVAPTWRVPKDDEGILLQDISHLGEDQMAADECYRWTNLLTAKEALPLVGSIAGGRKTMSFHLGAAFSVCARPQDKLLHVLVPPELETRDFLFPEAGAENPGILLVDVPFARLGPHLEQGLFKNVPPDRRDLSGTLKIIEAHEFSQPHSIVILVGDGKYNSSTVEFRDANNELIDTCQLRARELATFVAMAEAWDDALVETPDDQPVHIKLDDLLREEAADRRKLIHDWLNASYPNPWTERGHVNRGISDLSSRLQEWPIASKHLTFSTENLKQGQYQWKSGQSLAIELVVGGNALDMVHAFNKPWGNPDRTFNVCTVTRRDEHSG